MLTTKGQATRARIVSAAALLMHEHGVAGTSTEDVRAAAEVSSSQLYHYFGDKRALVHAVIRHWTDVVVGAQESLLAHLDDIDALRTWAEVIVDVQQANDFRGGCPLGSLASELADGDDVARADLQIGYQRWREAIEGGLTDMKNRGELEPEADTHGLATTLLTTLQGGLLLGKTLRDGEMLRTALQTVIDHVASFGTPGP